jgi:homoserine kinase
MRIRIPATTANIGPGFDSFGMALQLYNEVEITAIPEGLVITADGDGCQHVPLDEKNIVYQAMRYVFYKAGKMLPGLKIHIHNEVPITRGLGSSATAIVGGVLAANRLLGDRFDKQTLLEFATALEGHPDNVSAALLGGFVVSGQYGQTVVYKRFDVPKQLQCVVAVPEFQLSTSASRNVLPATVEFRHAVFNVKSAGLIVAAFASQDLTLLQHAMRDYLHEPYRMKLIPGMDKAVQLARHAGALGVALSGAGPSILALCDTQIDSVAESLQAGLQEAGTDCKIYVLQPDLEGARILSESPVSSSRNLHMLSRMD